MKSRLLAGVASAISVVAAISPTQAVAAPQRQAFSIPAGDLKSALDAYVRQTGRQLIYRADLIRGAHSPGVHGTLSDDAALAALLNGTGFVARTDRSGAIAIVSAAGNAPRAEAATPNNRTATADNAPAAPAIVIVGTRASLQSAEAVKRRSDVMIDGITADNIGQLPDVSISESLIRISGVTSNDTARGSDQVAIDGLGPDLVSTEYNGRVLPTADGVTRRVGLAGLPTEGISAAYAQKTPNPKTIEGGVAGILELETVKPLSTSRRGLTVVLRGLYSDTAAVVRGTDGIKPLGFRGEVSYTGLLAPNLGVTFSYAHLRQSDAETGLQLDGWRLGTGARTDLNGDGTPDALPTTAGPFLSAFNTTRDSLIATAQWKPSAAFLLTADGLYDRDHWTSVTRRYFANGLFNGTLGPAEATVSNDTATSFSGTAQQYRGTIANSDVVDHTYEGGLNLLFDNGGPFSAIFDGSIAEAGRDRFTPQANFENAAATPAGQNEPFAYDMQDRGDVSFTFVPLSASDYAIQQVNTIAQNSIDRIAAFREDSTYRIDNSGLLKSLQFGVRIDRRHHVQQVDHTLYSYASLAGRPSLDSGDLATGYNPFQRDPSRFGGDSATTFPYYDLDTLLQIGENAPGVQVNPQYGSDYGASSDVLEQSYAGYGQANIDTGRLTGNIGGRYILTNETDQGLSGTSPSNAVLQRFKNSYRYFLPSLNLKYAFTRTFDVRFAASRTMSRPTFGDLAVGSSTNLAAVDANGFVTINRGNPDLKPFTADGINVAAEWYPNRAMSFAVFGYYKWVTNFTTQSTITSTVTLPDGTVVPAFINQTINESAKKHFRGFEVQARRDFTFLPGALRFLGIQGNWNHNLTDARDTFTSLVGNTIDVLPINFSRDVVNAQIYYSRRDVDVHVAYRYYSGYSRTFSNGYQYMPGGQFDAGASFALRPGVRLLANVTNILGTTFYRTTADYRFPDSNGILQHYGYQGRDFTLGIRANF